MDLIRKMPPERQRIPTTRTLVAWLRAIRAEPDEWFLFPGPVVAGTDAAIRQGKVEGAKQREFDARCAEHRIDPDSGRRVASLYARYTGAPARQAMPRGTCSHCGQDVPVNQGGETTAHAFGAGGFRGDGLSGWCPGSGIPPA